MSSPAIKVEHFKGPNFSAEAEKCIAFIRENDLKRDQIVSITQQETYICEGDSWIALFYRTHARDKSSIPLDNLKIQKLKSMSTWAQ